MIYRPEDLGVRGFLFVELDAFSLRGFLPGGPCVEWLAKVADTERFSIEDAKALNAEDLPWEKNPTGLYHRLLVQMHSLSGELERNFPFLIPRGPGATAVKKIEYEENRWHYDIDDVVTNRANYEDRGAVQAKDRDPSQPHTVVFTLPFPITLQNNTICRGWDDECDYQAPAGYGTLFFGCRTWHRGDRDPAHPRGLFMKGFDWPGFPQFVPEAK